MTTSKAIRILSKYKEIVIIYTYDHWRYQLECEKDYLYLSNRRYTSIEGNKTEEITCGQIITQLENNVMKITDYIPNMTITYSDMVRRIQDYIKDPIAQPIELTESKKLYDKFMEEHKNEIRQKNKDYMTFINNLGILNLHTFSNRKLSR